jgi:hypothetical protein
MARPRFNAAADGTMRFASFSTLVEGFAPEAFKTFAFWLAKSDFAYVQTLPCISEGHSSVVLLLTLGKPDTLDHVKRKMRHEFERTLDKVPHAAKPTAEQLLQSLTPVTVFTQVWLEQQVAAIEEEVAQFDKAEKVAEARGLSVSAVAAIVAPPKQLAIEDAKGGIKVESWLEDRALQKLTARKELSDLLDSLPGEGRDFEAWKRASKLAEDAGFSRDLWAPGEESNFDLPRLAEQLREMLGRPPKTAERRYDLNFALGPFGPGALTPTKPLSLKTKAFQQVLDFFLGCEVTWRDVPRIAQLIEDLGAKGLIARVSLKQQRLSKAEGYVAERTGEPITGDQHKAILELVRGRRQCQECLNFFDEGVELTGAEQRFKERIREDKDTFCSESCKRKVLGVPRCLQCNSRVKFYTREEMAKQQWPLLTPDCCGTIPELPPFKRRRCI